jgi:hypothetical protein
MISSSIRLRFGGEHVDCTMKQVTPRTFSPDLDEDLPVREALDASLPGRHIDRRAQLSGQRRVRIPAEDGEGLVQGGLLRLRLTRGIKGKELGR